MWRTIVMKWMLLNFLVNAAVDCFSQDFVVSFNAVSEAVNCLKFDKNDGYTGLSTNQDLFV